MIGPNESAVWETLGSRLAGLINRAHSHSLEDDPIAAVERTFTGLFNGARSPGSVWPTGGLFVGKAECEWDWPAAWENLREMGLIEYHLEERPNHPSFGGATTYVHWSITDNGWETREDDLKFFNEVLDARGKDEARSPIPKETKPMDENETIGWLPAERLLAEVQAAYRRGVSDSAKVADDMLFAVECNVPFSEDEERLHKIRFDTAQYIVKHILALIPNQEGT